MKAFLSVHDLVPPASADLGDLRSPILDLPSFMTPEWFFENFGFSDEAKGVLEVYSKDIRAETGAPFDDLLDSGTVTVEGLLEMLRYPLFMRAVAARASAGDPVRMPSLFSVVREPVNRFVEALSSNADHAYGHRSPGALAESIMENGTVEQISATVQMFSLCALLVPYPGVESLMDRYPAAFGDAAGFIREASIWISAVERHIDSESRPAWELFREFHAFVPARRESAAYRVPVAGASRAAQAFGSSEWFPEDAPTLQAILAAAPGVVRDAGMPMPASLEGLDDARAFIQSGLDYPLFLISLACRLALLRPRDFPVWHVVFRDKLLAANAVIENAGFERVPDSSLVDLLADNMTSFGREQRQTACEWLVINAMAMPTKRLMDYLRSDFDLQRAMGPGLIELVETRFRSTDVPYMGPSFEMAAPRKGSTTQEIIRSPKRVLN